MSKLLNDLIESGLSEYTLTDKTKALVILGMKDSQDFIDTCDARETEIKRHIAQLRVDASQQVGMLRQSQASKEVEIDAVKELIQILKPRKVQ